MLPIIMPNREANHCASRSGEEGGNIEEHTLSKHSCYTIIVEVHDQRKEIILTALISVLFKCFSTHGESLKTLLVTQCHRVKLCQNMDSTLRCIAKTSCAMMTS